MKNVMILMFLVCLVVNNSYKADTVKDVVQRAVLKHDVVNAKW